MNDPFDGDAWQGTRQHRLQHVAGLADAEVEEVGGAAARFLLLTPPMHLAARAPYGVLAATAVATLPAWARKPLRLAYFPPLEATVVPVAGRVRIVVSGVNPTDWKHRQGTSPGQQLEFPEVVPHHDGAGVVDAVGAGVTDLAVGDRVWVFMAQHQRLNGTAQEYVALPDAVGFDVGTSLGVPAITAHRALTVAERRPSRLAPGVSKARRCLSRAAPQRSATPPYSWPGGRVPTTS